VILNFTKDEPVFELPSSIRFSEKELLIGNYAVDPIEDIQADAEYRRDLVRAVTRRALEQSAS
jgi:hypothetical protein